MTAFALVLAGCGAGGNGSSAPATSAAGAPSDSAAASAPAVTKDDALAAMVPADISADGKIVFGTDASYPPNEFTDTDGTTIIGMDVDLGTAVAQKLGLTPEFQNSTFDGIIPGISAGKYEIGMSSFSINDDRVKEVDMVSYYSAGTSLGTKTGNPDGVNIDDLCGKAIGVQTGTVQAEDLAARNTACTTSGKAPIAITQLTAQTDVTLALTANRIVGMLADSPIVAYAAKTTDGAVEATGEPYDTAPYGIVLAKNKGDFGKAIQGAVQALIDDGSYKTILDKWNVADGAVPTSELRS